MPTKTTQKCFKGADEQEGVRDDQRLCEGIKGTYGFTSVDQRNDFFFDTYNLFDMMRSLPEFQQPTKRCSSDWDDKFIIQTAINHGLIGFDEDFRFVSTVDIEFSIKSCTGGFIQPYELKVVSNG